MKVSVVICTYTDERFTDTIEAVKSIVEQSYLNTECVLIIDRNTELFDKFKMSNYSESLNNLIIGLSTLSGLSNARNRGVELATGDIIAFIDDDSIADVDWILHLIANYDELNVIGVGGRMNPLWIAGNAKWIPSEFYWAIGCSYRTQRNDKHYVRSTFGSNMSFKSAVFEDVGLFNAQFGLIDDTMRTGEETEFSIRVLSTIENSRIIYDPNAVVFHKIYKYRKSLSFLLRRCYSYGYAIASMGTSKEEIDIKFKSTENTFLKYLFTTSYSDRFTNIIRFNAITTNIMHIFALSIFTISVGIGFICRKIAVIRKNE